MSRSVVHALCLAFAIWTLIPVSLLCIWLLKPAHRMTHELYCCQPMDVLGNAQELRAEDTFAGCLAKRGQPITIPTETADGRIILFYVACSVGQS